MPKRKRQIWLVACPGTELLDLAGPWEVFAQANELAGATHYETTLVSVRGSALPTRHRLNIAEAVPLSEAEQGVLPHTLIVTGGAPTHPLPHAEARLARWLRRNSPRLNRIVSVCTGAFVLAEAGLLDGRNAITHWLYLDELQSRFPAIRVSNDSLYIRDGKVWTSAGITAGIDLALALVEEDAGHQLAFAIARQLVLFLHRSGGQAQFSEHLRRQNTESRPLRNLQAFILTHIDEPISVNRLAEQARMSSRTFARWFPKETGESPAQFVKKIRVEEAKRLLIDTDGSLAEVAALVGLGTENALWRAFRAELKTSPAEFRKSFRPNSIRLVSGVTSRATTQPR